MRRQHHPTGNPLAPNPHPKPALSYEDWEAKAPLNEIQTRSVGDVKRTCETRRLPGKFVESIDSISRPSTPINRLGSPSPKEGTPSTRNQHPLHPAHPITTPQEFHDWFALIDKSISHSQEAHFRAHLDTVSGFLTNCDGLLEQVNEVDEDVTTMMADWTGVEEGGQSLQGACERMLEERDRLIRVTDAIEERLEYFQELEYATRMLNHPGDGLVLQDDFLFMVERVDVCIEYLEAHRDFKESQLYLMRYQHCLTRAMTLIKLHFVASLRPLTAEIQRRLSDKDVSQATQMLLLYPKFQSAAKVLRPLIQELESRAKRRPDELSALLNECHAAYFGARKQLITGRLVEEIQRVIKGSEGPTGGKAGGSPVDLVELTRTGCGYLKQLCSDEFNLYRKFFDSGEDRLYRYLEGLCDYLYDDLRPRILHEQKLAVLCQVCTVIQALMVLDLSADYDEASEDEELADDDSGYAYEAPPISPTLRDLKSAHQDPDLRQEMLRTIRRRQQQQLRHLHVGNLLEMVLQDAQTRLVFKAQAVIQSEIRYYVTKDGDLDFPQKLLNARKANAFSGPDVDSFESGDAPLSRMPSLAKQSTWYPTLKKTHWVLSQLHDYPAIFEDIAYEAISLCRESLISASDVLSSKATDSTHATDGQLFLIRHLLVLKEMAVALGLDAQKERGVDFSGVTDTLGSLLYRPNAVLGQGLSGLRFPKVVENIADARLELDAALKVACEAAISKCVASATSPLQAALTADLTLDKVSKSQEEFMKQAKVVIPAWVDKLKLYLDDDERTVGVLLTPMQEQVVAEYAAYRSKAVNSKAGGEIESVVMSSADILGFLKGLSL